MALWLDIADALSFLGLAATALAVASAVAAAIAFAIVRSPAGGAAAVVGWLCCVILSLCSGFAGHWHLPAIALAALPTASILVGLVGLHVPLGRCAHPEPDRPLAVGGSWRSTESDAKRDENATERVDLMESVARTQQDRHVAPPQLPTEGQ